MTPNPFQQIKNERELRKMESGFVEMMIGLGEAGLIIVGFLSLIFIIIAFVCGSRIFFVLTEKIVDQIQNSTTIHDCITTTIKNSFPGSMEFWQQTVVIIKCLFSSIVFCLMAIILAGVIFPNQWYLTLGGIIAFVLYSGSMVVGVIRVFLAENRYYNSRFYKFLEKNERSEGNDRN